MKYLLDTHTVLWCIGNSQRLPSKTKEIIVNREKNVFISAVSLWETAIKVHLGKLELHSTFDEFLDKIRSGEFEILQIKDEYLRRLSVLPSIHKDPFDRLLVSTALAENLTIITADENVRRYNVPWIW